MLRGKSPTFGAQFVAENSAVNEWPRYPQHYISVQFIKTSREGAANDDLTTPDILPRCISSLCACVIRRDFRVGRSFTGALCPFQREADRK